MQLMLRSLTTLLLAVVTSSAAAQTQATVRVTGRVLDSHQALALPGTVVEVVGTSIATNTDLDGRYVLNLAPGKHQLRFTMPGFSERLVSVDTTEPGQKLVDVVLAVEGVTEAVTVVAEGDAATMAVQLLERRRANTITDNMASQEMRANADSSAASALQRVPGLSVVDNSFVFVRGLGERYSNTTLNGATLPSTEPERKVVSLDMFPSSMLESVSVVKSFTPDRSAEFAGGLVEIVPNRLASRRLASVSYSFGGSGSAWRQDILDHVGGGSDWLGLPNGDRSLPADFPARRVVRGGLFTPEVGVSQADLKRFGEELANTWTPRTISGRPNQGFGVSFGDRWGRFGLSGSLSQGYSQDYQEEDQVYYSTDNAGNLSPFSTYDYRVGAAKGSLAGLVNAGYEMTPSNRLTLQVFSTNKSLRETRTFEGFNDDAARNLRNARLLYQEESLRSVQVGGEHFMQTLGNSRLEWRGAFSRSSRDEPDIRETLYQELTPNSGVYTLADESQSGLRMFNDLDEDAVDISASWSTVFTALGLPASVKFGPSYVNRQRDFSSRRFRFVPLNVVRFDLTQTPEQLFSSQNIGTRYELREETRSTDFYDAEQDVVAGFGMVDVSLSSRARLVAGARVEKFRQTVDTFDLFDVDVDGEVETIRAEIKETDIFPAVNVAYDLGGNKTLRLGFSQTVNRPEFRELAPFEFTDIVGGRAVVGNPDLERSLIRNVDVRWEWFPGAQEVIAASVFLKAFDQPIERFVRPTAQLQTSFTNADSARNVGFELEARRQLTGVLLAGGNYTFVDSSITLNPAQLNVLTTLKRPLAGTSKHVVNGFVEARRGPVTARLLANYFDERIVDVGSLGLPDIFEEGRTTVDLVASVRVGPIVTVRLAAENLTNEEIRYLQGPEVHRRFTLGRAFSLQFAVTAR
jgi:outer membrane receptor protein involved in Fe transport